MLNLTILFSGSLATLSFHINYHIKGTSYQKKVLDIDHLPSNGGTLETYQ